MVQCSDLSICFYIHLLRRLHGFFLTPWLVADKPKMGNCSKVDTIMFAVDVPKSHKLYIMHIQSLFLFVLTNCRCPKLDNCHEVTGRIHVRLLIYIIREV